MFRMWFAIAALVVLQLGCGDEILGEHTETPHGQIAVLLTGEQLELLSLLAASAPVRSKSTDIKRARST